MKQSELEELYTEIDIMIGLIQSLTKDAPDAEMIHLFMLHKGLLNLKSLILEQRKQSSEFKFFDLFR